MTANLTVGDLTFEVRRSSRRHTLELIVDRGGELVAVAPARARDEDITRFIRQKQLWVYKKLAQKRALRQPIRKKEFVTGESFSYLGRKYRLLLVDKQDRILKLEGGRFRLLRREARGGRQHFLRWYSDHGRPWLERRVKSWSQRLGVEPHGIRVRDLGQRWASCGSGGRLNFHWSALALPPSIVDYLIVHELLHLREPHHTVAFWKRVERALPDYLARKQWLAENGGVLLAL